MWVYIVCILPDLICVLNSFIDNLVDVFNIAACRLMIAMFDVSLILANTL